MDYCTYTIAVLFSLSQWLYSWNQRAALNIILCPCITLWNNQEAIPLPLKKHPIKHGYHSVCCLKVHSSCPSICTFCYNNSVAYPARSMLWALEWFQNCGRWHSKHLAWCECTSIIECMTGAVGCVFERVFSQTSWILVQASEPRSPHKTKLKSSRSLQSDSPWHWKNGTFLFTSVIFYRYRYKKFTPNHVCLKSYCCEKITDSVINKRRHIHVDCNVVQRDMM